jgi:hypothetical protein
MAVQLKWELDPQVSTMQMLKRPLRIPRPVKATLEDQVLTQKWIGTVKEGEHRRVFNVLGALRAQCKQLSGNAAALALPEPALALVGKYDNSQAQLAVLGSDHLFGIGLLKAGDPEPLLEADKPVDADWDFTSGMLSINTTQATSVRLATAEGILQLQLTDGRHQLQVYPQAYALGKTQEYLASLMPLALAQPRRTDNRYGDHSINPGDVGCSCGRMVWQGCLHYRNSRSSGSALDHRRHGPELALPSLRFGRPVLCHLY